MSSELPSVVHVTSVHRWTDNRIHYREGESLASVGYRVSLVALESEVGGDIGSVEVHALPRVGGRVRRVILGTGRAIKNAWATRAEVFHLHDPELVWAVPLLRLLGKTVIYDAHEDLPVQVRNKHYLPSQAVPFAVLLSHVAIRIASLSNHVIAATEAIAARFPSNKVSIVHNYPPLRKEEDRSAPVKDREKCAVYVGGIGTVRGAEVMVAAAEEDCFPSDWKLRMAGTMSKPLFENLTCTPGWGRCDYRGQLTPNEARDLLLTSRVGLVLFQDTAAHREALPTKMFEYFAAGLPVIVSDFPLWRSIIEKYDCGLLVDEKSPDSVAAAVAFYDESPELLERHSRNARAAAATALNWDAEVATLLEAYDRALGRYPGA